jgi:hypothetical protein
VGVLGAIANPPKSEEKYVEKLFNWSEFHLSEMTCYKIHTLVMSLSDLFSETQNSGVAKAPSAPPLAIALI